MFPVENFRIAAVQCNSPVRTDESRNLSIAEHFVKLASENGADLAVFPEVNLSGSAVNPEDVRASASPLNGKLVEKAVEISGEYGIYCVFGMYERSDRDIYNTSFIAGKGRLIGFYRKVHIPPREIGLFTPGSEFRVFTLPFARVGISICYDNEFAESHNCLALEGAEVIAMPTGWADHWEREDYIEPCLTDEEVVAERERWMRMMFGARCRDTGAYSALANSAGTEAGGPWRFVGKSMIFSPSGKALSEASAWKEDIIYADLKADLLEKYRKMDAFTLNARRPVAYGPLLKSAISEDVR